MGLVQLVLLLAGDVDLASFLMRDAFFPSGELADPWLLFAASSLFFLSWRLRIVEFQWFLTELSVRPGSSLAISAH